MQTQLKTGQRGIPLSVEIILKSSLFICPWVCWEQGKGDGQGVGEVVPDTCEP